MEGNRASSGEFTIGGGGINRNNNILFTDYYDGR